jgi:hypothetical protein
MATSRLFSSTPLFVRLGFTPHLQIIGHMATSQLYWWKQTPGALPCMISGKNGHMSRTTCVPYYTFVMYHYTIIYVYCILHIDFCQEDKDKADVGWLSKYTGKSWLNCTFKPIDNFNSKCIFI